MAMCRRLFLVASLYGFLCCAGGASENSVSRKIQALAGDTVVLPCHISVSDDIPTVEWSKEGLHPDIVFLYRDGCETHEMKNLDFQFRSNLFMNELKYGNISLRVTNVQLSDKGTYICKTLQKPHQQVVAVELVVGAVSEPKLSAVPAVDGGKTLQCEANCWWPEPEITFHDEQGNNISAETQKSYLNSRGCFTVTRRATATTNRVTCRVHQPQINQMRVTDIYMPDDSKISCTVIVIIVGLIIIILCFFTFFAYLYKKCGKSAGGHKLPDNGSTTEVYTQRNQADMGNACNEHLRNIDELMLSLHDKEKIIHQLTEELKEVRSKQSHVVCQHDQPLFDHSPSNPSPDVSKPNNPPPHQFPYDNNPKPASSTNGKRPKSVNLPQIKDSKPGVSIQFPAAGPLIQRSGHSHSSPALLTDYSAVLPGPFSEENPVRRTMSLSVPRRNNYRAQRRSTFSTLSNNPYSVLADLPEDSELLLS